MVDHGHDRRAHVERPPVPGHQLERTLGGRHAHKFVRADLAAFGRRQDIIEVAEVSWGRPHRFHPAEADGGPGRGAPCCDDSTRRFS